MPNNMDLRTAILTGAWVIIITFLMLFFSIRLFKKIKRLGSLYFNENMSDYSDNTISIFNFLMSSKRIAVLSCIFMTQINPFVFIIIYILVNKMIALKTKDYENDDSDESEENKIIN